MSLYEGASAGALASAAEPEIAWNGPRPISPVFEVIGAAPLAHAAAPTIEFEVEIRDGSGREVFAIALTTQIHIEPARRAYDDDTRAQLLELFGEPERWGATTRTLVWGQTSTLVGHFTDSLRFSIPLSCTYDLEIAAAKYFYSLPGGIAPLSFHFSGAIMYRGDDGAMQVVLIPWSCSVDFQMPVATWKAMMREHYPNAAWACLTTDTLERLRRMKADRGLPSYDACVVALLDALPPERAQ